VHGISWKNPGMKPALGAKVRNGIGEAGLLLVLPLAFYHGFAEQFSAPKFFLAKSLMIAGLAVWALGGIWGPAARPARPFLRWPLLAFSGVALASCFTSPVPRFSLMEVEFALCGPAWVLLLVSWESSVRRIAVLTGVGGALVAGIALAQRCGFDPLLAGGYQVNWGTMVTRMRLYSTFGNPNYVGGYLIGTIFPILALMAAARTRLAKVLWGSLAVTMLTAIVETASRGAWLGLAIGVIVAGLVILPAQLRPKPELRQSAGPADNKMPAFGIFMKGWLVAILTLTLTERLISQFYGRVYLWRFSLPLFWKHPVLGSGWGTYQLYYLELQGRFLAAHPEYAGYWTNNRLLHNDPLQLLLETGILGFAALVWVLWEYGREARRALRQTAGLWTRYAIAASAGGVTAILVDSIFNYQFAVPATYILLFTLLTFPALLQPTGLTEKDQGSPALTHDERTRRWPLPMKLAITMLIITVAAALTSQQVQVLASQHVYQTAADLEDRDDLAGAESGYRRSIDLNRWNGPAHFGLSRVLYSTARPAEALAEVTLAERTYTDSHQEVLRGYILAWMNRSNEALAAYRHALWLDPTLTSVQGEIDRLSQAR
jgi:O-antigen ligase